MAGSTPNFLRIDRKANAPMIFIKTCVITKVYKVGPKTLKKRAGKIQNPNPMGKEKSLKGI